MWLVEEWGTDKFRETIAEYMGGATLAKAKEVRRVVMRAREKKCSCTAAAWGSGLLRGLGVSSCYVGCGEHVSVLLRWIDRTRNAVTCRQSPPIGRVNVGANVVKERQWRE